MKKPERVFMQRLRRFLRDRLLLNHNPQVGTYSGNKFCDRAWQDLSAALEQKDFLPAAAGGNANTLEIGWAAHRYGTAPFSRYYLVTHIIEGDVERQEVTFHVYERRFAGMFALHRQPIWRKREITVPVGAIKGDRQNARNVWEPGIDQGWSRVEALGRMPIDRLAHFREHLGF